MNEENREIERRKNKRSDKIKELGQIIYIHPKEFELYSETSGSH